MRVPLGLPYFLNVNPKLEKTCHMHQRLFAWYYPKIGNNHACPLMTVFRFSTRSDHRLESDVGKDVSLYLLIEYPSEHVSIKNLLSVILASPSVVCPYAGELCATNNCLILMTIIKMVGYFIGRVSLKIVVKEMTPIKLSLFVHWQESRRFPFWLLHIL
jgi:hypothetical protein